MELIQEYRKPMDMKIKGEETLWQFSWEDQITDEDRQRAELIEHLTLKGYLQSCCIESDSGFYFEVQEGIFYMDYNKRQYKIIKLNPLEAEQKKELLEEWKDYANYMKKCRKDELEWR